MSEVWQLTYYNRFYTVHNLVHFLILFFFSDIRVRAIKNVVPLMMDHELALALG